MNDFLAAEPLMAARLREELPEVTVLGARDLATVRESGQVTPALHLLLDRFDVGDQTPDGTAQEIVQQWLVILVVRSAEGVRGGAGAKGVAGPLLVRTIRALSGWLPPGGEFTPLRHLRPALRPEYSPGGFLYFPLSFTTSCVIQTP